MISESQIVLIVDDEPDICFLLGNMMKQMNFRPVIANSLSEGLARLRQLSPALLFLDIHLPDGSGLDVIRTVKKDIPAVKIIMISAFDGAGEKEKAVAEGVDDFISKPLSRDTIVRSVKLAMGYSA